MNGLNPVEVTNRPQLILFLRATPSWLELCKRLQIDPYSQYSTITDLLFNEVSALRDLGILEFESDPRVDPPIHDSIHVSDTWRDFQGGLGLSLHDLVKVCRNGQGLAVTPLFGRPSKTEDHSDIFVIMPFKPEYDVVYTDHVRKVANQLGLSVARADDRLDSGEIMKAVWADIFHAKVVLAECTERNANVFYELGIVHTLGKPTVMIRRKGNNAPFDIAGLRWIEYEYTPPGMSEFEQRLTAVMKKQLAQAAY